MSERVRHMNETTGETTDDTIAAEATTNTATTMADDGQRWDLGTLFPAKGDSRRPPEWLGRALLYIAIAIVVFSFCWRSWGQIAYLVMDIVVSLFLALAVEPVVVPLVKHGWKRAFASLFALVLLAVILCTLFGLFGNMFVQQVIAMINGLPDLYKHGAGRTAPLPVRLDRQPGADLILPVFPRDSRIAQRHLHRHLP